MSNQNEHRSCGNCFDAITNPANEPCKSCNGDSNWSSRKKKPKQHFPDTSKMMDVEQYYDWWMENKRVRFTSAKKLITGFASEYLAYVSWFKASDDGTLHWEKTEAVIVQKILEAGVTNSNFKGRGKKKNKPI